MTEDNSCSSIEPDAQDNKQFELLCAICGTVALGGTSFFIFYLEQTGKHFPLLESVLFWGGREIFALGVVCLWAVFLVIRRFIRFLHERSKEADFGHKPEA